MLKKNNATSCAVITGASGTLGSEIAIALALRGIRVVAIGRSLDRLETLKQRASTEVTARLSLVPVDVTNFPAVRDVFRRVAEENGPPQILVNAAGSYGAIGEVAETDPIAWRRAIDVNLMGTYNCCHCVLPYMISANEGSIISLAGGGASGPLEYLSSYGVSKAGIARLMDSIASEIAATRVRVNAILPGAIDSPMQDQLLAAGQKAGHWLKKIKALREFGEGATASERTVVLIEFLLFGLGKTLSGKLLSARYDHVEKWTPEQIVQISKSTLYSLRRIDPSTIIEVMKMFSIDDLQK